MRYLTL